MNILKGLLLPLALLFVTPGSMDPPIPGPSNDNRKRRIIAECTACGYVTDTEGGVASHQCRAKVRQHCCGLGVWRKIFDKNWLMNLFLWPAKVALLKYIQRAFDKINIFIILPSV